MGGDSPEGSDRGCGKPEQSDQRLLCTSCEADEVWRDRLQAHKETFLTGSYARSTAIKDIKDVDEICLLDINPAITQPEVVLAWMDEVSL